MKKILDIGQCDHDHGMLQKLAQQVGAQLRRAATAQEALTMLRSERFDLVWVNRMLDADNSFGIEIIKAAKRDPSIAEIPMMLVSNFPDAQMAAVTAGALPGFGKDALHTPATIELISTALNKSGS